MISAGWLRSSNRFPGFGTLNLVTDVLLESYLEVMDVESVGGTVTVRDKPTSPLDLPWHAAATISDVRPHSLDVYIARLTLRSHEVKCIGDCYMAAGGIFSEINQPAEHAKQVVGFGLKSIRAILDLNRELNENLRIRVGVNTGGPIVAGVLGIGKPTFEILGPAINMAQQMEHHGVPMAVHITRSVYELIYSDAFKVHERGMIEVKGGRVLTYLVMPDS